MAKSNTLLYVGIAAGAYLFLTQKSGGVSLLPGSAGNVPLANSIIPTGGQVNGINSGIPAGNGSFNSVSNYNQVAQANPNILNPNYQMTAAETAQYANNYWDLKHAYTSGAWGTPPQISYQQHWSQHGCAEKRIFVPLLPPCTNDFVPQPPAPKKAEGGNTLSTVLGIATTVLGFLGDDPVLNNADVTLLVTGGAIVNNILPMFAVDPRAEMIASKYTALLKEYV